MLQTEKLKLNKIELTDPADITVINPNWDTVETEITTLKTNKADITYVNQKVADLVGSAPEALDTLKELSEALGNDPNFATTISTEIGKKVDKVSGKGLSTNDYTTAEKTKLAGIATNANNYTHPSTHPASIITGLHSVATSGNADTAKKLASSVSFSLGNQMSGSVSFDGSSNVVLKASLNIITIPTNSDLNTYVTDGIYRCPTMGGSTSVTNKPIDTADAINGFTLHVERMRSNGETDSTVRQTFVWSNRTWIRLGTMGSTVIWTGWREVAFTNSDITGNASTATKLQTARTINGVSFDGTANITIADSTKLPLSGGILTGILNTNSQIKSTVATGTAPFTVASTTAVTNLNADMLDGLHSSSFLRGDTSNPSNLQFGSESGLGVRFFSSNNFSICMSQSDNSTYGGRVLGEDTSDYNMYFRMGAGTNRGFVFKNEGNCVMGIDASGNVRAKGGMAIGDNKVKMQYNSTTESLDFIFV